MSLKITTTPEFVRQVKRLAKDYRKIHQDLEQLKTELQNNPRAGVDLGHHCYKVRMPNSSIPTGKRGGFRVVTYYLDHQGTVRLVYIFSKRDQESITDKELQEIIARNIPDRK